MSRRILITGGSRGIGAAISHRFAALGDRVAVNYAFRGDIAETLVAELPGSGHLAVSGDLRDPDQVKAMVDEAAAGLGGIDVLVNNAGVFFAHHITEASYEEWQQAWADTLGTNLLGAANVTYCAIRHMPTDGTARIVNVGSRGAFRGEPKAPAYGASKAGIAAFGQSMAKELGSLGIAVAPGFVETEMATGYLDGPEGAARKAESPFNRVATAEEVADAVIYLASPQAQWASGAILDLNGASYLRM
jgi:3-oxoacyl-[acyl-carrier protein] reductase